MPVTTRTASDKAPPGRPKDLGKRAAILAAAARLFVAQGFDGTSMGAVAAAASVSKLTVYSHFGDKDSLFTAAVSARCEQQMPATLFTVARGAPIEQALLGIARGFHGLIHSDEAIALHRMMIANAGQSTHLAELFYAAGPRRILDALEGFLRQAIRASQLQIADVHLAAEQFFVLCKGLAHMRRLVGCSKPLTRHQRDRHLAAAVELFLRGYRRR